MIRAAASSYGTSSGSCRCTGLSVNAIKKANRKTAAAASGAIYIERCSHNSRRTAQYMRRLAVMPAGVVICDSRGDLGTGFDGVLIEPLLVPVRFESQITTPAGITASRRM